MRARAFIFLLGACVVAPLAQAQAPTSAQRARPAPAPSAAAAPVEPPGPVPVRPARAADAAPRFTPVEPGTRDLSPLGTSLRRLDLDLRVPTGFDRVYAVTPSPPVGAGLTLDAGLLVGGSSFSNVGARWFARMNGGLIALFPRSTFTPTPDGVVADVPAGTIYVLGRPSLDTLARATNGTLAPPGQPAPPRRRASVSAQRGLPATPRAEADAMPASEASLLDDAGYRRRRLAELLARAQGANRAQVAAPSRR